MLATLVIGLREGLEAALIVGIIAAFLRRSGKSLTAMWVGVASAIGLSVVIGIGLHVVADGLPQQPQEAMETAIGAIAVVFVTGMVLWMSTHARFMKRDLEASASSALGNGSARALAIMAFLAVLKEGFESAVFLMATFQHSSDTALAVVGAVVGILIACGVGYGLYSGGISINLGRFFQATSVFLVLVAAGLVVSAIGTAHEAGWISGGQAATWDLSWLAPSGDSVQGALVTGVLGIPPHPVLIQVLAWFAYVIPMSLLLFWPAKQRISTETGLWVRRSVAAAMVLGAGVLALSVHPSIPANTAGPLVSGSDGSAADSHAVGTAAVTDTSGATLHLTVDGRTMTTPLTGGAVGDHRGVAPATSLMTSFAAEPTGLPDTVSAEDLVALSGGRLPVGIDPAANPGPFQADWVRSGHAQVWTTRGRLLDISGRDALVVTLTGGGLTGPRTLSIDPGAALPNGARASGGTWHADPAFVSSVAQNALQAGASRTEAHFFSAVVPIALVIGAVLVLARSLQVRRRRDRAAKRTASYPPGEQPRTTTPPATDREITTA